MGVAFAFIPIQRGSRDSYTSSACRIKSTVRVRRIEGTYSVYFIKIDRIPSFDIHYSIFSFLEFPLRLNWPLFRPAAEPMNAEPLNP